MGGGEFHYLPYVGTNYMYPIHVVIDPLIGWTCHLWHICRSKKKKISEKKFPPEDRI